MSAASHAAAASGAAANATTPLSSLTPVLAVEHLSMRFGGLVAVNDLCFTARRGDITALIGPNGAGKTTVFNCITGFYKPSEGRIALQFGDPGVWEELGALTERGTRSVSRGDGLLFLLERMPDYLVTQKARVARTFQNIRLFPEMTALENVLVGADAHHVTSVPGALFTRPFRHRREEADGHERARELLDLVGIADRAEDAARNLPYGYQRRLEIARALATEPKLLCLDEPAAGFNPAEKQQLMNLIRHIRDLGYTVLLIEHDMGLVMNVTDRIAVLDFGRKIAEGTPAEVRANPRVQEIYLGTTITDATEGRHAARSA
jgi:branched-chain amino acid transport system ATP-binding protein